MREKEAILFIPLGDYAFEQQLATARYFVLHSNYEPHFLLISDTDHRFIKQLDTAEIAYNTLDPVRSDHQECVSVLSNRRNWAVGRQVKERLKQAGRSIIALPVGQCWKDSVLAGLYTYRTLRRLFIRCKQLWRRKQVAKKTIGPLAPCCAVVSQERLPPFLPVLRALRELSVPTILMPAADSSPDGCAWLRRNNNLLKAGLNEIDSSDGDMNQSNRGAAIFNRLVEISMPSQVYDSRWGRMLFTTPAEIFSLKIMGMLPQNLWYQGTTFADYIMISGIDEETMYAEAEVDPQKLLFFGSHELDVLYEAWLTRAELRDNLCQAYGLDEAKGIIIVALPPLWEHGLVTEEVHWQSLKAILQVLADQKRCNVLISLHPRMNPADYEWIEESYPVKICRESLKDILAIADLFVAVYSSTIRWALALDIPAINLDFWELNLTMYENLRGYQTVTTIPEFDEALRAFASGSRNDVLNDGSSSVNDRTGILMDGRAKERLLQFIQSLNGRAGVRRVPRPYSRPVQYDPLEQIRPHKHTADEKK